ncbi:hypothetical protein OOU_Y34scaffold00792g2 [Pyricularia oryzae Y34]|uniref:Uncharacterized protein n=1 Tax=Pyricularia oryzae (strain Y34) TaxID=1143189 RepID=A0AA97PGY5_PYRO3|nr:hypothetical protein OOU_Y34scaffold00792g2 [Pyricularia oryzae Y34]
MLRPPNQSCEQRLERSRRQLDAERQKSHGLRTRLARYEREKQDLVDRINSLQRELRAVQLPSDSSTWATASQQDNDSPRQPLDSAPPLPSRYHRREEKHRPTQSQDQRMLVDLTTEDTGFRCSKCTQIFNSSDNCFALSSCGCGRSQFARLAQTEAATSTKS